MLDVSIPVFLIALLLVVVGIAGFVTLLFVILEYFNQRSLHKEMMYIFKQMHDDDLLN